jgi:hypothetical protein
VDCNDPSVDPEGDGPFSESCIGVKLCEGTPVRGCGGEVDVCDNGDPCEVDTDCTAGGVCNFGVPTTPCEKDTDCAVGVACEFLNLEPPVPDGFRDLVRVCDNNGDPCQENTDCTDGGVCDEDATGQYVCICEENVLYLGPKCSNATTVGCTDDTVVADCDSISVPVCNVDQCSNNGATCTLDSDCGPITCVEQIVAEQCIFFTGDAKFKRGGKSF